MVNVPTWPTERVACTSRPARGFYAAAVPADVASTGSQPDALDNVRTAARLGVFGGTFDPIHVGHLMIALEVTHALSLDAMLLVVANDPWQKEGREIAPAAQRLALAAAAVDEINERVGAATLLVSDIEIRRGGATYTADTLEELAGAAPDRELFLLVGADAAAGLHTWHRPERVRELATTVVVARGGETDGAPADWPHTVVPVPAMEVSSTDLRARFADGRPVAALVPDAVEREVRKRRLYGARP